METTEEDAPYNWCSEGSDAPSRAAAVFARVTDGDAEVVGEGGNVKEQACKEAEEQPRKVADEQAKLEAEEQARIDAEEQARKEAEEQARSDAEEQHCANP
jgi:hypothetical protein